MTDHQHTFTMADRERMFKALASSSYATLGVLYRASYSQTFAADLRELLREIPMNGEVADGWLRQMYADKDDA